MSWSKNFDWSVFNEIPSQLKALYLKKLKIDKKYPSREYLDELINRNLCTIPFQNLSVTLWNEVISLKPIDLMEKILIKSLGGYCFELNGIFLLFLQTLGFNAWMCMSRQLRHDEKYSVPATHCGIIVCLDGKLLFL